MREQDQRFSAKIERLERKVEFIGRIIVELAGTVGVDGVSLVQAVDDAHRHRDGYEKMYWWELDEL